MTLSYPLKFAVRLELEGKLSYFSRNLRSAQKTFHSVSDIVNNVQHDTVMLVQVKNGSLLQLSGPAVIIFYPSVGVCVKYGATSHSCIHPGAIN